MTTASREQEYTDRLISELRAALDERSCAFYIDMPIDRALEHMLATTPAPTSIAGVHAAMAQLVQSITATAPLCPLALSTSDALAEAIQLLEQGYQSDLGERGYDAAIVDAVGGGPAGTVSVLGALAGIIKRRERQKHVRGAIAEHLYGLSPQVIDQVAAAVRHRMLRFADAGERSCVPYSADGVAKKIMDDLRSDAVLQGFVDSLQMPRIL